MESVPGDIPGTVVYMDGILVTGRNEKEHLHNLDPMMLKIMELTEYLGHSFSSRSPNITKQNQSYFGSTSIPEHCSNMVVSGDGKLLQVSKDLSS